MLVHRLAAAATALLCLSLAAAADPPSTTSSAMLSGGASLKACLSSVESQAFGMGAPAHFQECLAHTKDRKYVGVKDGMGEHKIYGYCDTEGKLHKLTDPSHPAKGGFSYLHELTGWTEGCVDATTGPIPAVDKPAKADTAEFSDGASTTIPAESKKLR